LQQQDFFYRSFYSSLIASQGQPAAQVPQLTHNVSSITQASLSSVIAPTGQLEIQSRHLIHRLGSIL
jgi:hypothetical protein